MSDSPVFLRGTDLGVPPGADIAGIDIGGPMTGWTGGNRFRLPRNERGYRIDLTGHKVFNDHKGVPIQVYPGAGWVELIGPEVHMSIPNENGVHEGGHKGIGIGRAERHANWGDQFVMRGGRIVGERGTFGVHGRNYDGWFDEVEWELGEIGQHCLYWGGFARFGLWFRKCKIISGPTRAEGWKVVYRPWESPTWVPSAKVKVEDCHIRNVGQGIILQGCGADVKITGSSILDLTGDKKTCIGIDNGVSYASRATHPRAYDHNGVPYGPGAYTGKVRIERSAFETPDKLLGTRKERIGDEHEGDWPNVDNGTHTVVEELHVNGCGFYGGHVDTRSRETHGIHAFDVDSCNTPEIDRFCADTFGMNVADKARFIVS